MDEINFKLCLLLLDDSRMVYRELADKVGLSVNAVHGRIKELMIKQIIQGFQAHIGENALQGSIKILVHGESTQRDLDKILEGLSQDKYSQQITSTGDDYHYIYGLLPDMTHMSKYIEKIPKLTGIEDPKIFLPDKQKVPQTNFDFKKTDYKIIHSLHEDARKSFSKVADELGVSTKTIRRRINEMEKHEAIDYTIDWYPVHSDDFIGILHAKVEPEKRNKKLSNLKKYYYPNVFKTKKCSNDPEEIFIHIWGNSLKKIHKIRQDLKEEENLKSIKTRMFYDVDYFNTWRDKLLKENAENL